MSYCPKCGRKILEESLGCPFCSVRDNIDYSRSGQERLEGLRREEKAPAQTAPKERMAAEAESKPKTEWEAGFEEEHGEERFFERHKEPQHAKQTTEMTHPAKPAQEKKMPLILKIIVLVAVLMAGFFGEVIGAIAGAVLYKKESEDLRKFGKILIIFCLVLLALQLAAVILFGLVSSTMMVNHHVF